MDIINRFDSAGDTTCVGGVPSVIRPWSGLAVSGSRHLQRSAPKSADFAGISAIAIAPKTYAGKAGVGTPDAAAMAEHRRPRGVLC